MFVPIYSRNFFLHAHNVTSSLLQIALPSFLSPSLDPFFIPGDSLIPLCHFVIYLNSTDEGRMKLLSV